MDSITIKIFRKQCEGLINKMFPGQDIIGDVIPNRDWLEKTIIELESQIKKEYRAFNLPREYNFMESLLFFIGDSFLFTDEKIGALLNFKIRKQEPGEIVQTNRDLYQDFSQLWFDNKNSSHTNSWHKVFKVFEVLHDLLKLGGYTVDDILDIASYSGIPLNARTLFISLPLKGIEQGKTENDLKELLDSEIERMPEEDIEGAFKYFEAHRTMVGDVFAQLKFVKKSEEEKPDDSHSMFRHEVAMLAFMRASKTICENEEVNKIYNIWLSYSKNILTQLRIQILWLGFIAKVDNKDEELSKLVNLRGIFLLYFYFYTEEGEKDFFQQILPIICATPADKFLFTNALKRWKAKDSEPQSEFVGEFYSEYKNYIEATNDNPVIALDSIVPVPKRFDDKDTVSHCTIPRDIYHVNGLNDANTLYNSLCKLYQRLKKEKGEDFDGDRQTFIYRLSGIEPRPQDVKPLVWRGSIGEMAYLLSKLYGKKEGFGIFENKKLSSFFTFTKSKGKINLSSSADSWEEASTANRTDRLQEIHNLLKDCGFKIDDSKRIKRN